MSDQDPKSMSDPADETVNTHFPDVLCFNKDKVILPQYENLPEKKITDELKKDPKVEKPKNDLEFVGPNKKLTGKY